MNSNINEVKKLENEMSQINDDALKAKMMAVQSLDDSDNAIHRQWSAMSSDEKIESVRTLIVNDAKKTDIERSYISDIVDSGAHREVVAKLNIIAQQMSAEASNMVTVADIMNRVATIINYAVQVAELFGKLA